MKKVIGVVVLLLLASVVCNWMFGKKSTPEDQVVQLKQQLDRQQDELARTNRALEEAKKIPPTATKPSEPTPPSQPAPPQTACKKPATEDAANSFFGAFWRAAGRNSRSDNAPSNVPAVNAPAVQKTSAEELEDARIDIPKLEGQKAAKKKWLLHLAYSRDIYKANTLKVNDDSDAQKAYWKKEWKETEEDILTEEANLAGIEKRLAETRARIARLSADK